MGLEFGIFHENKNLNKEIVLLDEPKHLKLNLLMIN